MRVPSGIKMVLGSLHMLEIRLTHVVYVGQTFLHKKCLTGFLSDRRSDAIILNVAFFWFLAD